MAQPSPVHRAPPTLGVHIAEPPAPHVPPFVLQDEAVRKGARSRTVSCAVRQAGRAEPPAPHVLPFVLHDYAVRKEARPQFAELCAKLDALSHLHYRPKPLIEEVAVKVDVPAILMEEVAPQVSHKAVLG